MSWFSSSSASTGPKFHSVSTLQDQDALFGPLVKEDLEWLCAGGFVTETQTWYATTPTGGLIMCQVIHSSVGVWYPSIQFTFRYVEPSKGVSKWLSIPVTNFVPGSSNPKLDKRSSKSDQFTITVDPAHPDKYAIEGKYDDTTQISFVIEKLAEGFKVGAGPRGGLSYFGTLSQKATATGTKPDVGAGGDGYAVHRFWPRCAFSGIIRLGGEIIDIKDSRGVFVHAIQGLRPNVLAAKWNFANFQSTKEEGISLIQMEFETTPAYGSQKVNIGSVVVGDKLVAVTAGGDGVSSGGSSATHLDPTLDVETDYKAPSSIQYEWVGTSLFEGNKISTSAPKTKATLVMDLKTSKDGEAYATRGLIEKVDVLGQIPYLIKKFVNYAAGTKPYIYTWLNDVNATIVAPADYSNPSNTESRNISAKGVIFSEATFIS